MIFRWIFVSVVMIMVVGGNAYAVPVPPPIPELPAAYYLPVVWHTPIIERVGDEPANMPSGLGVGVAYEHKIRIHEALQSLGNPYWHDWGFGITELRHILTQYRDKESRLTDSMLRAPEDLYFIFNEPEDAGIERVPEFIGIMEELEATGSWLACCGNGIGLETAGMEWIEEYVRLGGPVPAYWHIHIYDYCDGSGFDKILDDWYAWLDSQGLHKRTIVTETAATACRTQEANITAMTHIAARVESDPHLEAAFWFVSYSPEYPYCSLLTEFGEPTEIGKKFAEIQKKRQ